MSTHSSWLIETDAAEALLNDDSVLFVDMGKAESYAEGHLPGAVFLDFNHIISANPPVMGLLPSAEDLNTALSRIGYQTGQRIVAYDGEGSGRSGRLSWTLNAFGQANVSVINGGLLAWTEEQRPLTRELPEITPSDVALTYTGDGVMTKADILSALGRDDFIPFDARSPAEYAGTDVRSERGGHIPGAVNFEWTLAMDPDQYLRLKPEAELRDTLENLGFTPDKTIACYCQTHHRSAHSWVMLRHLGYAQAKGFPGAWSDWGNDPDTPTET